MASGASADLAFLAAAARRSIDDLARTADRVPIEPGRRGAHFLGLVNEVLKALEAAIADHEAEFEVAGDEDDRKAVIRSLRKINHYVMSFHSVTPWIESAQESSLGLGTIYFVDDLVTWLIKQPADVVISPSPRYNFSVGRDRPFEDALIDLGIPAYPVAVTPVLVNYPAQEPESLFLHLIIAHELGHRASAEHSLVSEVLVRDPNPGQRGSLLAEARDMYATVEGRSTAFARRRVWDILSSWLEEILCDGCGLGALGPAYLFSDAAFATPFGGPEPSESHPPTTLRTKLLVQLIDAWGWRELLERQTPKTFAWIEAIGQLPQESGHQTYFLKLEEVVDELARTLQAVLESHLGDGRYDPGTYDREQKQLATMLENNVLPAQLDNDKAADRRAVILAGWFEALRRYGDRPLALVEAISDREYQGFLTKTLERSTVLERWKGLG